MVFTEIYDFTAELLQGLYEEERKSIRQIARQLNCSGCCIRLRLIKNGIKLRTPTEGAKGRHSLKNHKTNCQCSFCKAKRGELKGIRLYDNPEDHPSYIDGRTFKTYYCKDCNVKIGWQSAVYGSGLCKRCCKLNKNNPSWNDGSSFEPYGKGWTETLKESIRQRDNYICQKCGKAQGNELKELNRRLSIHHIDYDKSNLDPKNLIAFCSSCNVKVNRNREYWKQYFSLGRFENVTA